MPVNSSNWRRKMAENKRISRELQKRENTVTNDKRWAPASTLPIPQRQDGKVYRWIRVSMQGTDDPTNVSKKTREGWEKCRIEDYPELELSLDPNVRNTGLIVVGGLMLCSMPEEMAKQRNDYFSNINSQQIESVDNSFMKQNDPRMPLYSEKNTKVSFGKG